MRVWYKVRRLYCQAKCVVLAVVPGWSMQNSIGHNGFAAYSFTAGLLRAVFT